jgi:hypothetical protein
VSAALDYVVDFWRTSKKSIIAGLTTGVSTWAATGVLDWRAFVGLVVGAVLTYVFRNEVTDGPAPNPVV